MSFQSDITKLLSQLKFFEKKVEEFEELQRSVIEIKGDGQHLKERFEEFKKTFEDFKTEIRKSVDGCHRRIDKVFDKPKETETGQHPAYQAPQGEKTAFEQWLDREGKEKLEFKKIFWITVGIIVAGIAVHYLPKLFSFIIQAIKTGGIT